MTLEPRRYSEGLGVIDGRQLQRASDLFDLGEVVRAEPASAGLWGQNILLSTTAGEFVLRGNPQTPYQLSKEQLVAAEINRRSTLPVPFPYHLSNDLEVFGWPFAVMPLLAGTMGARIWEDADDAARVVLAAAHGHALAELHQATFDAPGPYDDATNAFVPVDDFKGWTLERIETLRARCRDIDALPADAERFIDEVLASCSEALTERLVPVLVHHDFSLANTNYQTTDAGYHATGVFDLGEAHIGDGEEDLIRFLFRRKRPERAAFPGCLYRRPAAPSWSRRSPLRLRARRPLVHVGGQQPSHTLVRGQHIHRDRRPLPRNPPRRIDGLKTQPRPHRTRAHEHGPRSAQDHPYRRVAALIVLGSRTRDRGFVWRRCGDVAVAGRSLERARPGARGRGRGVRRALHGSGGRRCWLPTCGRQEIGSAAMSRRHGAGG